MFYLQVNHLIDEAGRQYYYFLMHATHSLEETSVHFHADNCCGQNKNILCGVFVGLHKEIKVSFLKSVGCSIG